MVISIVSLAAHCPGVGVNIVVNVPSELLLIGSGDHVPVKPSLETNGNASTLPVTQYGPSCVKVAGVPGSTVSVTSSVAIHPFP